MIYHEILTASVGFLVGGNCSREGTSNIRIIVSVSMVAKSSLLDDMIHTVGLLLG